MNDLESVVAAARTLFAGHTEWIAVTSAAPDTGVADEIQVVLVTRTQAHVITHARIDATPKGTGDLFSAALTGYWLTGTSLPQAVAKACQQVLWALRQTEQAQCAELLLPIRPGSHGEDTISVRELVF